MLLGTLDDAVRDGADQTPVIGITTSTYLRIRDSALELALRLERAGVRAGTHVAIDTVDAVEFAIGFFAVAACGAVVVLRPNSSMTAPAGTDSVDTEFVLRSDRSRRVRVIAEPHDIREIRLRTRTSSSRQETGPRLHCMGSVVAERSSFGTMVLRNQANLAHEIKGLIQAIGLNSDDRVLCTLPIDTSPGLSVGLLAAVQARAAFEFIAESSDGSELATQLARKPPTVLVTGGEGLAVLKTHRTSLRRAIEQVRLIVVPRSPVLSHLIEARMSLPCEVMTIYHHPEAGVIALNRFDGPSDCAGHPLPGVRVTVEHGWSSSSELPVCGTSFGSFLPLRHVPRLLVDGWDLVNEPGVAGQIVVQGQSTCAGLGRCYTGDSGYLDASGDVHILTDANRHRMRRRSA